MRQRKSRKTCDKTCDSSEHLPSEHHSMFKDIRQFRSLMASLLTTCTTSATPGSHDFLVASVWYDSLGWCDEAADDVSARLSFSDLHTSCLDTEDSAVAKLTFSGWKNRFCIQTSVYLTLHPMIQGHQVRFEWLWGGYYRTSTHTVYLGCFKPSLRKCNVEYGHFHRNGTLTEV